PEPACSTDTPFTTPSSEFIHAGGARSGAGSDASASRRLIFLPTRRPDRRSRACDALTRLVDRVESGEQHVAQTLLELACEIAAQATGPASPEQARMRPKKAREQKSSEQERREHDKRCGNRSKNGNIDAGERRVQKKHGR